MSAKYGNVGYGLGYVADQTQLLQVVTDGLGVYNKTTDPLLEDFSQQVVHQTLRVSQAPIQFNRHGDGATPDAQRETYRLLNIPLQDYDAGTPFTVLGLQDALPSDIEATVNAVMAGDAERMEMEFFRALFTSQTIGSVGTAYQAGFWNGELDVPDYKNNTFFGTAHSHYKGLNTTTLALSHIQSMKKDIQEHGYGVGPRSLVCFINSAQSDTVENLLNINVSSSLTTPERIRAQDEGAYGTGLNFSGVEFVVNDNVPSGYLAMVDRTIKPVAKRVHLNPAYVGLQMYAETFSENFPLAGQKFLNRYGFSIRHLGAGSVRQLVASTSYTNPSFRLSN